MSNNITTENVKESATPAHNSKTGVEKTQSVLTIVSTSIGILGAIGTGCVWLASTFYVGHLELKTENEQPGMAVKVFTKEGHESIFHTKWIDLMPGKYHIEVISPKGKSQHEDISVEFNKTHTVKVSFPAEPKAAEEPTSKKKKRWYQFWRSDKDAASDDSTGASDSAASDTAPDAGRGFGIGDGFLEQPVEMKSQDSTETSRQEHSAQQ